MTNVPLAISSMIGLIGVQALLLVWLRSAFRRATGKWGLFEVILAGQSVLIWGYQRSVIGAG